MLRLCVIAALAAALFVASCECAVVPSSSCSEQYQAAVSTAVEIRDKCDGAALYDCCQVKTFFPQFVTTIYDISYVCDNEFGKSYARCDMDSDGGGWLVIQRRVPGGTEDFERDWEDYEDGFGDLEGEFWYGLKNIHCLTHREDVELRIELKDEAGNTKNWTYPTFQVAGTAHNYRLTIAGGTGTSGSDAMDYSNGQQFSTHDNDNSARGNCAVSYHGAWWYNTCYRANLNGPHIGSGHNQLVWIDPPGTSDYAYYPSVEMKVRPKSCFAEN